LAGAHATKFFYAFPSSLREAAAGQGCDRQPSRHRLGSSDGHAVTSANSFLGRGEFKKSSKLICFQNWPIDITDLVEKIVEPA
jgi:hypothetical protein